MWVLVYFPLASKELAGVLARNSLLHLLLTKCQIIQNDQRPRMLSSKELFPQSQSALEQEFCLLELVLVVIKYLVE